MGIHHTHKAREGERLLAKQQKQQDRQRRSASRKQQKNLPQENKDVYVVAPDEVITLDLLTNPNKK